MGIWGHEFPPPPPPTRNILKPRLKMVHSGKQFACQCPIFKLQLITFGLLFFCKYSVVCCCCFLGGDIMRTFLASLLGYNS